MKKVKKEIYTYTGEVRPPKKGEYFKGKRGVCIADFDFNTAYEIITREVIEETWKPKVGESYWFIDFGLGLRGIKGINCCINDKYDFEAIGINNCFQTKEEAEAKLKEILEVLAK